MTMLRVKVMESKYDVWREARSLPPSCVMLQVIHQCIKFWMTPEEFELFPNVGERLVY